MAHGLIFTLQYSNEKSCSCQTNLAIWKQNCIKSNNLAEFDVLKLTSSESTVGYFHLSPISRSSAQHNDALFLNGLFASKIGFQNNTTLSGELLRNISVCVKAWLEPVTVDDWEILELHAEQVESSLLDQTRVLWPGQVFPLWVSGSVCIFLKTVTLEPNAQCSILMPLTELIIEPKVNRNVSTRTGSDRQLNSTSIPIEDTLPKEIFSEDEEAIINESSHNQQSNKSEENSVVVRRTIFQRFLQLSIVRRFLQILSYIFYILRHSILPMLTSPFNFGLFQAIPAAVNKKAKSSLSKNVLLSISSFPDKLNMVLRVEPMHCSSSRKGFSLLTRYDQAGYVLLDAANEKYCQSDNTDNLDVGFFLVALQKLSTQKNGNQENISVDKSTSPSEIVVRLCVQSLSNFAMIFRNGNCFNDSEILEELTRSLKVSSVLRRQLDIGISSKVCIKKLKNIPRPIPGNVSKIIFRVLNNSAELHQNIKAEDLRNSFETWLTWVTDSDQPIPVSVGSLFYVNVSQNLSTTQNACFDNSDDDLQIDIVVEKLLSEENEQLSGYFLLMQTDLQNVMIEFVLSQTDDPTVVKNLDVVDPKIPHEGVEGLLPCQVKIITDCITHAEAVFQSRPISSKLFMKKTPLHPGFILLTGPRGVGRTTLSKAMLRKLAVSDENHAYVQWISCSNLKGKKPETAKKMLQNVIHEMEWRQPSALLLDDFDHIVPSFESPDGDRSPNAIYALQLAAVFKEVLSVLCVNNRTKLNQVLVIATAVSEQSILPLLLPSHGCHLFSEKMTLQLPDAEERSEILRSILANDIGMSKRALSKVDANEISHRTEGYSQKDFMQLTKRAVLSSKNHNYTKVSNQLMTKDFMEAISGFVPISLQDANLHKPNKSSWSDVGGLHIVRKQLKEKLVWPMKYAYMFKTAGMQLQSGILLYGPPGCGKTLLAGVLANECKLNFISVKGPELLSKYIGASEAAVRELFTRASAAAPCILFFDEFDSIAQKRGHDSTGVTDRVVNQILTHLDGVEPLSGVYVLAATSRPDLIDPALLRPGRLDTHLQCPMPDFEERCDILKSLLSKITLTEEVNIRPIAVRCENFTGADLKALVYDAQLKALHSHATFNTSVSPGSLSDKTYSRTSESPGISSPEMEMDEEYNSNGIKSIHHDLKDEILETSPPPGDLRVTVNDVTKTAEKLVASIQNGTKFNDTKSLNIGSNQYKICYGISSPEYSSGEFQQQTEINSVGTVENEQVHRSIYFPSLCSKTAEEHLPESIQQLVDNIASSRCQNAESSDAILNNTPKSTSISVASYHFDMALESAGPSVSSSERRRYIEICRKFSGKSSGDKTTDSAMWELRKHQRATLA